MGTKQLVTVKQLEKASGLPTKEWAGKCYSMACKAAELLREGTAVYGHYLGKVHPSSIFAGRAVFVQHGWVVLPDGRVLDPTRWAFEGKEPYIYVGPCDVYDEGGNKFRTATQGEPPEFDPFGKVHEITKSMLPSAAWTWMEGVLELDQYYGEDVDGEPYEPGTVTEEQLHWIAHFDPRRMDGHAKDVYAMLEKLDMRAMIPFDNWRMVEQGRA